LSPVPPRPEPLSIGGPAGLLEALVEDPRVPAASAECAASAPPAPVPGFAVVCHPHPLHGGTLQNKVVHTLARVFIELGLPTLRFNFRGVGASEGRYDSGRGETEDALAVIAFGRQRWPDAAVSLAGFSFGAMVALRAAARVHSVRRVVSVAPPVGRADLSVPARPSCPWLIVQGDADEIVDHRQVMAFAAGFSPPAQLRVLPGVDHFFHGHLRELHEAVMAFSKEETR
jgi:uncharacterized protein